MNPSTLNPLIEASCSDTLFLASCAVKALARMHADQADAVASSPWADDEQRGLSLLLQCVAAAVDHARRAIDPQEDRG